MATSKNSSAATSTISDRAQSLIEQSQKVADDVRELGSIAVGSASDALQAVGERGKAGVVKARDGIEGYVAENPFKALLIAAGVGALLGYSLSRRS